MNYLDEMAPVIKELTGASWVVPRDESVRVRSSKVTGRPEGKVEKVIGRVHRDYTLESAAALYELQMQKGRVPRRDYKRFSIVQTWRAISPPPQDQPLVVCDAGTVNPDDLIPCESRFSENPAENFFNSSSFYNSAQQFYYFPDMEEDDVILLKGHDTLYPQSMYSIHSAIDIREHNPNAVPRESIESRYFVFFD